jgi:glycosyltransferase involved in cell wall biosynthesis
MTSPGAQPSAGAGRALTPGFLPRSAFADLSPTALGVVDLESADRASVLSAMAGEHRDALVLVRLHGDPLGVVHVADEGIVSRSGELVSLVHQRLGDRLSAHQHRFGCQASGARCRGGAAPDVAGAVAVVIPTIGRIDELDRCLHSIASLRHEPLEIIVVDNRPSARTRDLISSWSARDPRIRYVSEPRGGASVARNRGVAETEADFVAFIDDDVIVDSGWLRWLIAPFADPQVTVATGLVLPLKLETVAQKRFEQYAGFGKGYDHRSYDLRSNRADERLLYPYWGGLFGSGNNIAFRRAELVAAGGFDASLGPGTATQSGEDIDLMSQAILRGGRLVYEPRSLVWHEHRREDAALRRQLFSYGVGFTATLTKALTHDRRFPRAVVRSIPVAWRLRRRAVRRSGSAASLPTELAGIEGRGMLWGPVLYARSSRSARRLGLREVINGG